MKANATGNEMSFTVISDDGKEIKVVMKEHRLS